jgi:hypothetical protein
MSGKIRKHTGTHKGRGSDGKSYTVHEYTDYFDVGTAPPSRA